jgi:hypothetical protein
MNNLELLKQSIRKNIPSLMEIERGLLFMDKMIDKETQQSVSCVLEFFGSVEYSILYYNHTLDSFGSYSTNRPFENIIGKEPMLNDVLAWFKLSKYKYAHFEDNYFSIYNSDEKCEPIEWDLSKPYLKDQSEELVDFLCEEVLTNNTNI